MKPPRSNPPPYAESTVKAPPQPPPKKDQYGGADPTPSVPSASGKDMRKR